ncbi:MAG: thiol-disulfide isomerase/thioredoxin [Arcticibacterium sp.]|jgi:thiol-disulfide isomerase/thioredoxin
MKGILALVSLFFLISESSGNDTSVFLSSSSDVYLKASFSMEDELKLILEKENHQEFVTAFEVKFSQDFDKEIQYEKLKTKNVDEWELELFDKRNAQVVFLKTNKNYNGLSDEFLDLMQANINYNYWHLLIAYSINRSNANSDLNQVTSLPRIMTESLELSKINDPKSLLSKSYREFLPYFIIYFNSEQKDFKKYANGILSMMDKAEYASKFLKGDVLDFTLASLIKQNHLTLSSSIFSFWTSQIFCKSLKDYLNDSYYEIVLEREKTRENQKEEIEEKAKEKSRGKLAPIMDLSDKSFTFDRYKGKVIYVDFWASWCGPCRKEFPYSKKMRESFSEKEKENIVFLYISIDEDIEKWKQAVKKLGLGDFGENGHSYEVAGQYGVSSIPRYMIIDKRGNLVNDKAPRPSSSETLPALLELID